MTELTIFTAEVHRSKDWWAVTVPELDRVYTQAKSLSQVEAMVTEVIELVHDIDPDTFRVEVKVLAEDFIGDQFEQFLAARDEQMRAHELANMAAMSLAKRLVITEGLTQSDAAAIMGFSPQRVSQILKSDETLVTEDA